MSDSNKSYRIKANINTDTVLNVNLNQDFDILEVLSLKIRRENLYKTHTSNYGCVVGRVLGNGNFGIPNAKISIFVKASTDTVMDSVMSDIYPYTSISDQDTYGRRYNLLPDEKTSECHSNVGSFPNKRLVLDDDNILEIFENYYKYTTRSNESGDYMIFGVPVGSHVLHTDIDLSDIGILSQKPRDLLAQGYNINQFDNANQFKKSTDLDNLVQIITQNNSINVEPFWGDDESEEISITRQDINVQYKFEPTCVFMGSMVSDEKSNGISKECIATDKMGEMRYLTTGNGTIEMIRKTPDGDVEEVRIEGTQLIDGNGTWCYQIPMNLDYMRTDEYGNMVPTDDPTKGIPTRTRVRFRFSLSDFDSDYSNSHLAKVLVPNNPHSFEDVDYVFGTNTKDDEFATKSFRDLFWNNVYSVKSYIPRIQNGDGNTRNFTGIKRVNVHESNNPIPYNNIRIHLSFSYILQCAILKTLIFIVKMCNKIFGLLDSSSSDPECVGVGDGFCPEVENWYFAPGCTDDDMRSRTLDRLSGESPKGLDPKSIDYQNSDDTQYCLTDKVDYLMQCIEIRLAMETDTIEFDFFNDWINGLVYIPRWFVKIRKKRSLLFGLIRTKGSIKSCMENTFSKERRLVQQCGLEYGMDKNGQFTKIESRIGCRKNDDKLKCHKGSGRKSANIFYKSHKNGGGIVHTEPTLKKQSVYYFKPCEWILDWNLGARREVRANLFATDIILLGSLNDCDSNGLPQAFKYLSSSSFKIPTNLALTNMQEDGYMYGTYAQKNGFTCIGKNWQTGIMPASNSFAGYKKWASASDFAANVDYDTNDYAVTEAAGIDWGYSGPNQRGNDNKLHNPGGHFLGIACFAAQTNIKSCINLSRVCEIGADISQRQPFVVYNKEKGEYSYSYLIPTGFISKIDLSESDFRRMFASLNYNNLKTIRDDETQALKYEITPLSMSDFGGEMNKYLNDSKYNDGYNESRKDDAEEGRQTESHDVMAYTFTQDNADKEYYNFRLGLHGDDNAEDKYLHAKDNIVSMPVYENSYYFYFGLKDGNTAFDRFLVNYYAPCEGEIEANPVVEVNISDCEGANDKDGQLQILKTGSASVSVYNVFPPFTVILQREDGNQLSGDIRLKMGNNITKYFNDGLLSGMEYNQFEISKLTPGGYILTVTGNDITPIENKFTVNVLRPSFLTSIEVTPIHFTESKTENTDSIVTNNKNYGGFRFNEINNIPIVIVDINHYTVVNTTLNNIWGDDDDGRRIQYPDNNWDTSKPVYVWAGNNEYTIYAVKDSVFYEIGTYFIEMPAPFDYYIGLPTLTGARLEPYIFKYNEEKQVYEVNENWARDIVVSGTTFSEQERNALKQTVMFNSNSEEESLTVNCIGGTKPYTINVYGNGEKILGTDINDNGESEEEIKLHFFADINQTYDDGFKLDIKSFKIPTSQKVTDPKGPYMLSFNDAALNPKTQEKYDYSSLQFNNKEIEYYISMQFSPRTATVTRPSGNEDPDYEYEINVGYDVIFDVAKVIIKDGENEPETITSNAKTEMKYDDDGSGYLVETPDTALKPYIEKGVYISFAGKLEYKDRDVFKTYATIEIEQQQLPIKLSYGDVSHNPSRLTLTSDIVIDGIDNFSRRDKIKITLNTDNIISREFKTTSVLPYAVLDENIKYIPLHCSKYLQ